MKSGKLLLLLVLSLIVQLGYAQDHASEASIQVLLPEVQDMNLLSTWKTGSQEFNDIWGYVDSQGREYAIIGSRSHYYFVDITNPTNPQLVNGFAGGNTTIWRDMKTYGQWAYGVCDNCSEGLSIFRLGDSPASNGVQMVSQTTSFFSRAHNIFIDEPNGRMYVLGSNTRGNGVIVLDIQTNPEEPILLGSAILPGGYIHDMYVRNNIGYADSGPNGLYVYDLSNPNNIQTLGSLTSYPQQGYNHASWLNDAGDVLIMADETHNRSVKAVDVSDLSDMEVTSLFRSELLAPAQTGSIAHNPFVRDDYAIISYYHDGVQIFDISNPDDVEQVAWYDTFTGNTNYNGFDGCWGVYPYLPSGNIIASDGTGGLFVLNPTQINFSPIPPVQPPFGFVNETVDNCIPQGTTVSLSLTTDADVIQWFRNGSLIDVANGITATSEGTYQAIVYKGPHSLTLDPIEIVFGEAPDVVVSPSTNISLCSGDTEELVVSEGADTYEWFLDGAPFSSGSNAITADAAGTYTVVASLNGCDATSEEIIVTQGESPSSVIVSDVGTSLCNGESAILSSQPLGDQYSWIFNGAFLTGQNSSELLADEAGEYRLTVHLGNCITTSEPFILEFIEAPSISTTQSNNIEICEGEEVTLSVDGDAESFEWFKDGASINIFSNEITVSDAATYTLMAANGDCSAAPIAFEIEVTALPMVEILPVTSNVLCPGGEISLTVNTDAEQFSWTAPDGTLFGINQTTVVIDSNNIFLGGFTVFGTNGNCSSFDDVIIEAGEVPEITLQGPTNTNLCAGDFYTLSVEPGFSHYQWFRDEDPINQSGSQLQTNETGIYAVQVTSADGCSTTSEMVELLFNEFPNAQLALGQNQSLCAGQQLTLEAPSVADTYSWLFNGQVIANTASIDVSAAGVYQLSLTADACTSVSQEITVSVADELIVNFDFDTSINICEGETFVPALSQNFDTYQWYLNGTPYLNDRDIVIDEPGEYFLEVSSNECVGTSETFIVMLQEVPTVALSVDGGVALCEGETLTVTADATPGASLQWLVESEPIPDATEPTFTITEGGNYTVQVTNNGCSIESGVIDVFFSTSPISEIEGEAARTLCEGETLLLISAEAADRYVWLLDGVEISNQEMPMLEIDQAGEYTLMTFAGQCSTVSKVVSVTSLALPNIENISDDRVLCEGESFDVEVPAGVSSFLWFINGQGVDDFGEVLTISEPGVYQLAIQEGDCTAMSNEFEVTLLELASLDGIFEDTQICAGETINVTAPTSQAEYTWTRNGDILSETGSDLNISEAGTYQLLISQGECSSISNIFEVSVLELPALNYSDTQSCDTEEILIPAPSGFDTYIWTRDGVVLPETGPELMVSQSGSYQLEIVQEECNSISNPFEVLFIDLPALTALPSALAFCDGELMTLDAPEGADTYTWTRNGSVVPGADTQIQIAEAGTYQLEISLGDCFTISEEIVVTVNDTPTAAIVPVPTGLITCDGEVLTLTSEATEADSLFWFLDGVLIATNDTTIEATESGTYTLIAQSGECSAESAAEILLFNPLPQVTVPTTEFNICPGDQAEISVDVDPNGVFDFIWTTVDGTIVSTNQNIAFTEAGTYQVEVVNNATSCLSNPDAITVTEYEVQIPDLSLDADILTSTAAAAYQWFLDGEPIVDAISMTLIAETSGDYQVATTDANGCVVLSEIVSVVISSVAGIPSLDAFDIYPNPVRDVMTISLSTSHTIALSMDITNQLGQTLWTRSLTQSGKQQLNVPVDFLIPGLYYISLRAEDGGVQTIRFVKQ